jgi:SNF2 family DNA or RNA helicase
MLPVVVDSDDKKAWVVGRCPSHVFTVLQDMPSRKRFVNGVAHFELSRAALEHLDNRLEQIQWRGPAKDLIESYRALTQRERDARTSLRSMEPEEVPQDFPFKKKPFDHQLKAFNLSRGREYFGFFMEQGTGKTKVMIDRAADLYLNGGVKGKIDTLVIVTLNGVHAQWINEQIVSHMSDAVPWRGGYTSAYPTKDEAAMFKEAMEFRDGLRIISVHVDSLSHVKGQRFFEQLLKTSRAYVPLDESLFIKEEKSKRTKFILSMRPLALYRDIATGTPITQGVEDLYTQLAWMSPDILGYNSFYAFRNHFCALKQITVGQGANQKSFKKVVGYVNEEELKQKIDAHSYRVLKDDCLDLPPRHFIKREVLFTPEQRKIYNQMKRDFWLELESGILTARMAMTRVTRLQQLVNGFIWKRAKKDKITGAIIEPEMYQEFPNQRVQETINLINQANGKVIVWVKFEGDHRLLTRAMTEAGIGWVDYVGPTPKDQRPENIRRFREDPSVKVFLSSPATGGTGLDLPVATTVIWFSRDFSYTKEVQANDRCHRIGQKEKVNYFYLVTPKTVDEKIDTILAAKRSVAENIIDIRNLLDE